MALLCLIVLACDALNSSEPRGNVGKPAAVPVKYEDENAGDGPLRTESGECVALVSEALDAAFLRRLDDLASLPSLEYTTNAVSFVVAAALVSLLFPFLGFTTTNAVSLVTSSSVPEFLLFSASLRCLAALMAFPDFRFKLEDRLGDGLLVSQH